MAGRTDPIAFPILNESQIEILRGQATCRTLADGEALWKAGDQDFCFFVVLSGQVEIVEEGCEMPRSIAVHEVGQFTGDIDLLSGRPSMLSAYAHGETDILQIPAPKLRDVVRLDQDLGSTILSALMRRREILLSEGDHGLLLIGSRFDPETLKIREFLGRNRVLVNWRRPEEDGIHNFLQTLGYCEEDTPIVLIGAKTYRKPTLEELGTDLGIRRIVSEEHYDVVVVGAGPAGLAAGVYGASEGLNTLILDRSAPGGQASWSSRIENYMGFPEGLTGEELAHRGFVQAEKFGARLSAPADVISIECAPDSHELLLSSGERIRTRAVIVATGAKYKRIAAAGYERFEGNGIYYAATVMEADMCRDAEVGVIGAGNSAGQAVVFLAPRCKKVRLIVRGDSLEKTMSSYLANRIERLPNVEVLLQTEVAVCEGQESLEQITLKGERTGCVPCSGLFVFIGAEPNTDFLRGKVLMDPKGFVLTGERTRPDWNLKRSPMYLETSCPGLFAAGDCRADSIKRVASGVGEGAMAIAFVHQVLAG